VVLDGLAKRATRTGMSHDVLASRISWAIYGATREWFYGKKRHRNAELVSYLASIVGPMFETGVAKRYGRFAPAWRRMG
jgi:hypothetical protein